MMRDLKLHCRKVAQLILLIATKYIYYTHTPHIKRSRKLLKSQQRELSASLPSSVKTCTNFYDSNSLSFFTTQLQPSWPPRSFWKTTLAKFRKLRQNRTLTSQKFNILPRQSPPRTQGNHNHFALFGIRFLFLRRRFCAAEWKDRAPKWKGCKKWSDLSSRLDDLANLCWVMIGYRGD